MWSSRYFIAFFVALLAALVLTPLVRLLAAKLGFLDYPDKRKKHLFPMPNLGGLAVYIALTLGIFFTFYYSHAMKVILLGGLAMLFLGMVDDKKGIPATVKVSVLLLLAFLLSRFGVMIHFFHSYVPDLLMTLFWILLVTSAINAMDNMDGLASGISAVSAALFFIAALRTGQYLFGIISASLSGAAIGFLPYNFKPAKIFLGNGGSFFLGFVLASIAIMGEWSEYPLISYVIPVLILSVPIFDLSFVVLWRYKKGITSSLKEAVLYSGTDHLSHRLAKLGLTERRVVVILCLLNAGVGIGAVIALPLESFFEMGLLLFQVFIILSVLAIVINIGQEDLKK